MKQKNGVSRWELWVSTILRGLLICFGLYNLFTGNVGYGILLIGIIVIISMPQIVTRNRIKRIPIELEILISLLLLMQYGVGEGLGFYWKVPHFDKLIHTLFPTLIGLLGAIIVYSMVITGNLRINSKAAFVLIVLVALGVGAFWELIEYFSDLILSPIIPGYSNLQGNIIKGVVIEDPFSDTLNDLVADTIGAIIGASLGTYLIHRAQRKESERLDNMAKEFMTITDDELLTEKKESN